MKVVLTRSAYEDLASIGREIKRHNPSRAASFVDEIQDRCFRLGALPEAFTLIPGWEDRGLRRRPFGNYLIFYRVRADRVEVVHVLHGARDYETILFPHE